MEFADVVRRRRMVRAFGPDPVPSTMLDALLACKASVVLSGYASELYDDALTGWARYTKDVGTGQSGEWGSRVEVAWCNRLVQSEPNLFDLIGSEVAS